MTRALPEPSGLPGSIEKDRWSEPPGFLSAYPGYRSTALLDRLRVDDNAIRQALARHRPGPLGAAWWVPRCGVAPWAGRGLRARRPRSPPGAPGLAGTSMQADWPGVVGRPAISSEEVIVDDGPGSARRLLGVFAHPDDEVFCAGGTMARAAEAGAEIMIVSATRGERGQIRDATVATRRTLGAVREGELGAAAAELGVQHVRVLAYPDGTLQHHRSSLGAAIADIVRRFDPDTVVTFGADGGYGHPDHVAISELTTEAFGAHARDHNQGQRLYHAAFPPRRTSMAEELAHWIVESGQRATDRAALQAIALFADESTTMRLARDDVRVQWFPPGIYVIEQGEPADALYLILNGTADALLEHPDGQMTHLERMQAGDYFGELGLVAGERKAHVVARESLTCLVLSRTPVRPYAGRGAGPTSAADQPAADLAPGTCAVDVTSYLRRKVGALARHRTQYPIVPTMLPQRLLQTMLGTEFFCRTAGDIAEAGGPGW